MVSRRRFLALGPVLAATAAAGPKSIVKDVLPQASAAAAAARVTLTRSTFAPHVHGTFVAHLEALRPIELKLTAVQDLPGTARATFPDREGQFLLLFRGPRQPALDQGTYRVEHPAIGAFALFLVPVGESADARHYEAIFNRIAAPAAREA